MSELVSQLVIEKRKTKKAMARPDLRRLRAQIDQTKCEIEVARNHFDEVTDPTLIDCYIYEINAAQLRYQFLLQHFKAAEKL